MQDSIYIKDIEIWTHIGVPEEERKSEQRLLVTIEITHDLQYAGASDEVSQTIDYEAVCKDILHLAKQERKTIEKFAGDIAEMILSTYKPSDSVCITITKQIIPGTDSVSVTINRP